MVRPLLFLASVFLAVSGALKARSAAREGLSPPVLPMIELLLSVLVAAVAMVTVASAGVGLG